MDSAQTTQRPPYDPLLLPEINALADALPEHLNLDAMRAATSVFGPDHVLEKLPHWEHTEYLVPRLEGENGQVTLSVFKAKESRTFNRPVLYYLHGGGQVAGNRFMALDETIAYFVEADPVVVAVEYRLAPEHPAPAALNDSYAGILWTVENAAKLGIDPSKIVVSGASGGGPIALATTMLCVRNQKSFPFAQMILTPMLDDRDRTVSSKQFATEGSWSGAMNRTAWDFVLGGQRGAADVSDLIAPARATSLIGLPPTFVDAAECEVFRDETVAFASKLWESGVTTELHVWPGAYHGFDILGSKTPVGNAARRAKRDWVRRIFSIKSDD